MHVLLACCCRRRVSLLWNQSRLFILRVFLS